MKNLIYQLRQVLFTEENMNNSNSTLSRSIELKKSLLGGREDVIELYEKSDDQL